MTSSSSPEEKDTEVDSRFHDGPSTLVGDESIIKRSSSEYTKAAIELTLHYFEKEKVTFNMMPNNRFSFSTKEVVKCFNQISIIYINEYIEYKNQVDKNFSSSERMKLVDEKAKNFCCKILDYTVICIIFEINNVCLLENGLNDIEQLLRVEKPIESIDCILILKNIIKEKNISYFNQINKAATTHAMTKVYTKDNQGFQKTIRHCWVMKPAPAIANINTSFIESNKSVLSAPVMISTIIIPNDFESCRLPNVNAAATILASIADAPTKDLTKVTPKQINEVEEKSCPSDNFSNIQTFQSTNETTASRLSTQLNANFTNVSIGSNIVSTDTPKVLEISQKFNVTNETVHNNTSSNNKTITTDKAANSTTTQKLETVAKVITRSSKIVDTQTSSQLNANFTNVSIGSNIVSTDTPKVLEISQKFNVTNETVHNNTSSNNKTITTDKAATSTTTQKLETVSKVITRSSKIVDTQTSSNNKNAKAFAITMTRKKKPSKKHFVRVYYFIMYF